MDTLLVCPICNTQQSADTTCKKCEADLSLLNEFQNLASSYYAEAVRLAKSATNDSVELMQAATEHLQLALTLDPHKLDAYVVLGKIKAQRGNYDQAIQVWRKGLEAARAVSETDRVKIERCIQKAEELNRLRQERLEGERRNEAETKNRRMRAQRRNVFSISLAAFFVGGAVTLWFAGRTPSPDAVIGSVQEELLAQPLIDASSLTVKAIGGSVVIEGEVPTEVHKNLVLSSSGLRSRGVPIDVSKVAIRHSDVSGLLKEVMSTTPSFLVNHVGTGTGRDILDALAVSQISVVPATDDRIVLVGTVPIPEVKNLVERTLAGLAPAAKIDLSALNVVDEYITYTVVQGDYPEGIARRLTGTRRRLDNIRKFSTENATVLDEMKVGSVLKIPKRLLLKPSTGGPS